MPKQVIIPWSGGLDSTYLVYKNLLEGNTVVPVYINIINNEEKIKKEKEAIEAIAEVLKNLMINGSLKGSLKSLVDNSFVEIKGGNNNLAFAQMPIWIFGLLYTDWNNSDEIQIGYVMNDDAVSYTDDIKNIWKSYKPLAGDHVKDMIKIKFPLRKIKKSVIWDSLPHEVKDLTTFCEYPIDGDCGTCDSCKRYKYDGIFTKYSRNTPVFKKFDPQLSLFDEFGEPCIEQELSERDIWLSDER